MQLEETNETFARLCGGRTCQSRPQPLLKLEWQVRPPQTVAIRAAGVRAEGGKTLKTLASVPHSLHWLRSWTVSAAALHVCLHHRHPRPAGSVRRDAGRTWPRAKTWPHLSCDSYRGATTTTAMTLNKAEERSSPEQPLRAPSPKGRSKACASLRRISERLTPFNFAVPDSYDYGKATNVSYNQAPSRKAWADRVFKYCDKDDSGYLDLQAVHSN